MATLHGQLARSAASYSTKTALVFERREFTYRQLDEQVNRHAHALASLGVTKGDRVALMSGNSDRFIIAMYAVFRLGGIFVPVNPRATSHELRHLLADSGASFLLLGAGMTSTPVPWGRYGAATLARVAARLDLLVVEEWTAGSRVFVTLRRSA